MKLNTFFILEHLYAYVHIASSEEAKNKYRNLVLKYTKELCSNEINRELFIEHLSKIYSGLTKYTTGLDIKEGRSYLLMLKVLIKQFKRVLRSLNIETFTFIDYDNFMEVLRDLSKNSKTVQRKLKNKKTEKEFVTTQKSVSDKVPLFLKSLKLIIKNK